MAQTAQPGVGDLLFKLLACDEHAEGACSDWLAAAGLVRLLVARLDPALSPAVHDSAAEALLTILNSPAPAGGRASPLVEQLEAPAQLDQLWGLMLAAPPPPAPDAAGALYTNLTARSALISGLGVQTALVRRHAADPSAPRALHLTVRARPRAPLVSHLLLLRSPPRRCRRPSRRRWRTCRR